jgi:hypothetical protein
MAARRFSLQDSMVLIAAIAVGLVLMGRELRNLFRTIGHIGSVAIGPPPLRGRMIEDLYRDPSVNWALHDGSKWLRPGSLPGKMTLHWTLFDRNGPGLARRLVDSSVIMLPGFLVPLTLAVLVLRLRKPRPSWSHLLRQPGFWGCAAPVVAALVMPALGVYLGVWPVVIVPGSVMAAWAALALGRQWRYERSWVDRAGRVIGVSWIILLPMFL